MLHYRKSFSVRMSSARKLGLESLEDRSMLSVVTAALLPSIAPTDTAVPTDPPTAQVADAQDTTSETALLPLAPVPAEPVSSATAASMSESLVAAVDRVLLLMGDNQPPVIFEFGASQSEAGWYIFGAVSDPDDAVEGMVVSFGGVLASYNLTATVDVNGCFSVTATLSDLEMGVATAQTQDPHGALSNLAECWVFPT